MEITVSLDFIEQLARYSYSQGMRRGSELTAAFYNTCISAVNAGPGLDSLDVDARFAADRELARLYIDEHGKAVRGHYMDNGD